MHDVSLMTSVSVLPIAFMVGVLFRRRGMAIYRHLFRAQLLMLGSPLAFVGGMSLDVRGPGVTGLLVLLAGEVLALLLGMVLAGRGLVHPVAATSGSSNSGFWSIPVAGAIFGPVGAAFAAVYDAMGAARGILLVRILRRHARTQLPRRSAVVDYSPQLALGAALGLRLAGVRLYLGWTLPVLATGTAVVGFALLGMAMPDRWPRSEDWAAAAPGVVLRFGIPALLCAGAMSVGIALPVVVWVVALAPSPFTVTSFAALYGYPRQRTVAIPLLTLATAVALLPFIARLR